eukprot:gene10020-biopygen8935
MGNTTLVILLYDNPDAEGDIPPSGLISYRPTPSQPQELRRCSPARSPVAALWPPEAPTALLPSAAPGTGAVRRRRFVGHGGAAF